MQYSKLHKYTSLRLLNAFYNGYMARTMTRERTSTTKNQEIKVVHHVAARTPRTTVCNTIITSYLIIPSIRLSKPTARKIRNIAIAIKVPAIRLLRHNTSLK